MASIRLVDNAYHVTQLVGLAQLMIQVHASHAIVDGTLPTTDSRVCLTVPLDTMQMLRQISAFFAIILVALVHQVHRMHAWFAQLPSIEALICVLQPV